MANPREDSVLVNLRALRGIAEDREAEAREQERLRLEQARQALEEAERLRREDAARIVRAAEEARRRAAEEAAQAEREARLRVEEAERRARVEAEARLEQARLRLEIEAHAALPSRRGRGWVLFSVLLLCGGTALGALAWNAHQAGARAERQRQEAQSKVRELEAVSAAIQARQRELTVANAEERRRLEAEIARLQGQQAALQPAVPAPKRTRPAPVRKPAAEETKLPELCPPGQAICR